MADGGGQGRLEDPHPDRAATPSRRPDRRRALRRVKTQATSCNTQRPGATQRRAVNFPTDRSTQRDRSPYNLPANDSPKTAISFIGEAVAKIQAGSTILANTLTLGDFTLDEAALARAHDEQPRHAPARSGGDAVKYSPHPYALMLPALSIRRVHGTGGGHRRARDPGIR